MSRRRTGLLAWGSVVLLAPTWVFARDARADDPSETLVVGTARAAPGTVAYGAIPVAIGEGSSLQIPVAAIRGDRSGPRVAVIAGVHGTEYATTVALGRLIARIDPHALRGSLIVVPLANPPAFEHMAAHDSIGELPGDPGGDDALKLAAGLGSTVIKPSDVVIDLHGGDLDEDAIPQSFWLRVGRESQDEASKKLVAAFGLDHIVVWDVDLSVPSGISHSVVGYALSLGKSGFAAAIGRSGLVRSSDLRQVEDGLRGVLSSLGMIDGSPQLMEHPVWMIGRSRVNAEGPGMFFALIEPGSYVTKGMAVGRTTDYLGRPTGDVLAPAAGVVLYVRGVPSMWKGATLIMVGPLMGDMRSCARPRP